MKFGEKMRVIREEKDLSLSEFASVLGTSKQILSRYERGESTPKITTVAKYAEILGVTIEELVGKEPEKEKPAVSPIVREIAGILADMSPEQLAQVATYVRFIKSGG